MITKIQQTQPSRNTFGTNLDKSLENILSLATVKILRNDNRPDRALSFKPQQAMDELVMTVSGVEKTICDGPKGSAIEDWKEMLEKSPECLDEFEKIYFK